MEAAPRRPFQVHEAVAGHYPADNGFGHPAQAAGETHPAAYQAAYGPGSYGTEYGGEHQPAYAAAPEPNAYANPYLPQAQPYAPQPHAHQAAYELAQPLAYDGGYPVDQNPAAFGQSTYGGWHPSHAVGPEGQAPSEGGYFAAPLNANGYAGPAAVESWHSQEWSPAPFADAPLHGHGVWPQTQTHTQTGPVQAGHPFAVDQGAVHDFQAHTGDALGGMAQMGEQAGVTPFGDHSAPPPADATVATAPVPATEPVTQSAAERIAEGTLEKLSNVELMERLAIAMIRRESGETDDAEADADKLATPVAAAATPAEPEIRAPGKVDIPVARSALAALRGLS